MMESSCGIERLRREHEIFGELARALTSSLDHSEILAIVMNQVGELLKPSNWSLMLLDPNGKELRFELVVGEGADILRGQRLSVREGIAGWAVSNGESVLVNDARRDPRFCPRFDDLCHFETRSVICVPLRIRGKTLGAIELVNRIEQGPFTAADMRALESIAEYAAIAINNASLYKRAHDLSLIDDHTCLFNIRYLYSALDTELAAAREDGREVSMIFLDLDRFKRIVDTHGHLLASKTLKQVGFLIREVTRKGDIAVRYGGDEFVILMPGSGKDEAVEFARYLRNTLNSRFFLEEEGLNLKVTASFGVASFPEDAGNKEEILSLADSAMYGVKETTRDAIMTIDACGVRRTIA
ncbi:MAG: sensor domain-containing diguanylate cyclase [Desulfobacteraceae bacterium]|nr:sensor domain-containing diguanylate cyclase [Desulfobacteraceae bacterium]